MFLSLKEMKKEKARFIMIILVTTLIAYLVYFLSGLAFGLAQSNTTSINHWKDSKGVVISKSANDNIYASTIDEQVYEQFKGEKSTFLNISSTVIEIVGKKMDPVNMVLMGVEENNTQLEPQIVAGENFKNEEEIILSEDFKEEMNFKLGQEIEILKTGRKFKIVGFTESSKYNTQPVGYVSLEMASQAMMLYSPTENNEAVTGATENTPKRVSAIVVNKKPESKLLKDNDLKYLSVDDFIKVIPGYQAQVLTFGLMIISLILIASFIIGIFMFILTMQKKSIFAILKVQGIGNKFISQSVVMQTLIVVVAGALLGLVLTMVTFYFMPKSVPVAIYWPLYIGITILFIVCAMIGSIFSARSVLKIDPLDAL